MKSSYFIMVLGALVVVLCVMWSAEYDKNRQLRKQLDQCSAIMAPCLRNAIEREQTECPSELDECLSLLRSCEADVSKVSRELDEFLDEKEVAR